MSNFSHYNFQKAIYQTLSADSTLMGMINGVFDYTPQDTPYPYITLGDVDIVNWSCKTTNGTEQIVTIHIWSREAGRKQTANIMERIYILLHQASPAVTGQTLVALQFRSSRISLEDDGLTYKGVMTFRALLQST